MSNVTTQTVVSSHTLHNLGEQELSVYLFHAEGWHNSTMVVIRRFESGHDGALLYLPLIR